MTDIDSSIEAPEVEETEVLETEVDLEAERERIREEARAEAKAEVAKREKELQKGFDEVARREREVSTPKAPAPELDPDAQAAVKALIESEYAPVLQQASMAMASLADDKLKAFAAEKGVDPDTLRETISQYNLVTKPGLEGVDDAIKAAYRIHAATTFDATKERERIREELIAEQEGGVRIEGVREKKGASAPTSTENVHDMNPDERLAYYKEKYPEMYPD